MAENLCLAKDLLCDGKADCSDEGDEEGCSNLKVKDNGCPPSTLACATLEGDKCLPLSARYSKISKFVDLLKHNEYQVIRSV